MSLMGRRQPVYDSLSGAPAPRALAVAALFLAQLLLLSPGMQRDYRLKHEDNNALHATFARSHLQLGFTTTNAQNYFYSPALRTGSFYPNHPPGPGLALALVYAATGSDGPAVTRATAIAFHVLGTWLFYGLARRVLRTRWEVLMAVGVYVLLPESSFFGRMMNHEVMVLPAALLMVRGYYEHVRGRWPALASFAAMAAGAAGAAISGWAGFFAIGACALHAAYELAIARNRRALAPLGVLAAGGVVLFVAVVAHVAWGAGADSAYLERLWSMRSGLGAGDGLAARTGRLFELHWRYFGATSAIALLTLTWRLIRGARAKLIDPADEIAGIFLLTGAGYVAAFSLNASRHDYWQFLLLPASALAVVLVARHIVAALARGTHAWVWRAVAVLAILDVTATSALTLALRHGKGERYCIDAVAGLRRNYL